MKSASIALVAGLATLATSSPDPYQQQQCSCADAPYQYTTGAPGLYNPTVSTVTITEAAASTVTITNSVVITSTVKYGGSDLTVRAKDAYYTSSALPPQYSMTTSMSSNTDTAPGSRQTHHVQVGTFDGKVQFIPNNVNAEIDDIVVYNFLAKSHSLTQSEFLTPCTYNGGFDTGLNQANPMNISGLHVIPFRVTTKNPQWFYCKQQGPPNHCGKGMVFGLNPGNKMDQFIQNAINQNGNLTVLPSITAAPASSTSAASTSTATGAVTTVTVGLQNGTVLKFDPPYLPKVSVGQKIHFDFRAVNHTLTESTLDSPCKKLPGTDVDTNFQNANKADIPESKPFDLVIDSDRPRFFYCKQQNGTPKSHCGMGMVFAINTNDYTFRQFENNAKATLPKIKGRTVAI